MEQKQLRVLESDKTFFTKITTTISKILMPTKVGLNGMLITLKRNNVLKLYENYNNLIDIEDTVKKEQIKKKYEDANTLYLESIDKYIMDSIYKKVKANTASNFEKNALSKYYTIIHLKENEYIEYKYKKQKYLLEIDYETVQNTNKEKLQEKYEKFFINKIDVLYKGLLKNYSIKLADNLTSKFESKEQIYEKIYETLEEYIVNILPLKLKYEKENMCNEVLTEYDKFERFNVGKFDEKDIIEKKMVLLGISRYLFTHSLPLIVAEQCYIKLIKEARNLIVNAPNDKKRQMAYSMLINLIEDYNIKLLSTKVYWDKPEEREEYKQFWNKYKNIKNLKEKEILFIKYDMKKLSQSKKDYSAIQKFYKKILVKYGVMRQLKNTFRTSNKYTKKQEVETLKL